MLSYLTSEPLTACNRKPFLSDSYQLVEGLAEEAILQKTNAHFFALFTVMNHSPRGSKQVDFWNSTIQIWRREPWNKFHYCDIIYIFTSTCTVRGHSIKKIQNRRGASLVSWGVPPFSHMGGDRATPNLTIWFLLARKAVIHLTKCGPHPGYPVHAAAHNASNRLCREALQKGNHWQ